MKRFCLVLMILCLLPIQRPFLTEAAPIKKHPTYEYILAKNGYDLSRITSYYIEREDFERILSLLFNQQAKTEHLPEKGYLYGKDLADVVANQFQGATIPKLDKSLEQVLTFPGFLTLLDYSFREILEANHLTYESGRITLWEEEPKVWIPQKGLLSLPDSFEEKLPEAQSVFAVLDENLPVEIIFPDSLVLSFGDCTRPKELFGQLYYYNAQEDTLILNLKEQGLKEFKTLQNIAFLGRALEPQVGQEIYCYLGDYKKQLNRIAIAVERIEPHEKMD